jgi:hypothetical protein
MSDETPEQISDKIDELGNQSARLGIWMEHIEIRKGVSTYNIAKNVAKPIIKSIDDERNILKNRLKVKLANMNKKER